MKYTALHNVIEGRYSVDNVDYEDDAKTGKVTATLKSSDSAAYTKLGNKLKEIDDLEKQIATLKVGIKDDVKAQITDLFDASDAIHTRVVKTSQFIFTLKADPKITETPQYKKILEELELKLTPSLVKALRALMKKFVTKTQKSASLSYDKLGEQGPETALPVGDESEDDLSQFTQVVLAWGRRFDKALAQLQRAV